MIHEDGLGAAGVRNLRDDGDGGAGHPGLIAKDAWGEGQWLGAGPPHL